MNASRRIAVLAMLLPVLAACATTVQVPEIPILDDSVPFKAARREADEKRPVKIVEVPKPLPLPGQLKPVPEKKDKTKDEKQPKERVAEAHAAAKIDPAKDGYINAIQVYPYTKGALYQLYAAVNQVTDIALEAGEKLISVSAGDTVRWVVGDTTSGEGKAAQVHILIKPIGADLVTNLVITTDRRTYHLEMHSSEKTYMASVSWTYPASQLLGLKKQRAEADAAAVVDTGVNIEQLKFRYRIEGDAPWKPRQVFDGYLEPGEENAQQSPALRMFNLRQDFPTEWYRFLNPTDPTKAHVLELEMVPRLFPIRDSQKDLKIKSLWLLARCAAEVSFKVSALDDQAMTLTELAQFGGLPFSRRDQDIDLPDYPDISAIPPRSAGIWGFRG